MKKQVLFVVLMLMPLVASAYDVEINGIYYNLNQDSKQAEVTYYIRSKPSYTGSIVIPKTVTYGGVTYSVTSIEGSAFYGCSGLTSVTIPNSVTSIGVYAFRNCSGLTSITIPNSVTSIGDNVFYGCSGLTSITIPNSVTSIGDNVFYGCSGLTSLTIPNSVTSIGVSIFGNCSNLTSVKVESGNLSYDSRNNCNAIIKTSTNELVVGCKTTTIPNSVTSIGKSAFSSCLGLISVIIPNSVTSIGISAFSSCLDLTSVIIPNSVTSIGESAFYSCSGLTSVTIPNSVTSIGKSAFLWCSSLTSVTIPNSVTSIGNNAFMYCKSLTSVNINDMVAWCNISFNGDFANPLRYAKHLYLNGEEVTDLVIPDGVTSIGNYAFFYCTSLTSATIPNSVTTIGVEAFGCCSDLTSVTIGNNVTSIGLEAFSECKNLTAIYITDVAAWCQLTGGYQLLSPTCHLIINGLEMKYLKNLVIPDDGVTSIREGAFKYSTGLTSVTIGNNVISIGSQAFYECSDITSVTIGSGIKNIGSKAFANYDNLLDVYCLAEEVPTNSSDIFDNSYVKYATLHVPESSINLYKRSEPWSQFGSFVGIPEENNENKCEKPVITLLANGKIKVESATEGATCVTNITSSNAEPLTDGEISLSTPLVVFTVTSYATKEGYDDSEVATATFRYEKTDGDMNGDGTLNITDVIHLVNMILGQ